MMRAREALREANWWDEYLAARAARRAKQARHWAAQRDIAGAAERIRRETPELYARIVAARERRKEKGGCDEDAGERGHTAGELVAGVPIE